MDPRPTKADKKMDSFHLENGAPGSTVPLPGVTGLSRPCFTMVKWATTKSGEGTSYSSGSTLMLTTSVMLYTERTDHASAVVLGAVKPDRKSASRLEPPFSFEVTA